VSDDRELDDDRADGAPESSTPPTQPAGPDLARAALAAARAEARARGVETRRTRRTLVRRASTTRSGSGPDDRDPQLLGSVVDRLVAERGWEQPVAVGGVMARWSQIVGEETAAHVVPETFDDGELTVVCDSTAWATQMRLLAPTLVRRLNEELEDGTVRRVKVLGPSAPSWRRGRLRVEGRGPRDTYG
jgi:predicted nucleic acid-binding Zn ribbon protein